ncbi:MAG: glycine betaine/L-proline ABC transporter substrate-binding protein ProX [Anaerolineales bacterium]|nr:glycine betaine/L-proline ABC transporter substrate-binding protein ProX [Anaerolineales bacterium]MCB0017169.1 glycine betaine/L-proline ABC transporter substrate-binding protein ProX [Anaerolineales bacterium]MCB0026444.1 glycine betaine/L-proline ABC transporter substrate-binding protein ProX [Anaerolineales bacterium]MCB8958850.1 glycine betaine/L-proline ABC transporter substrate-binding protein ProX [Ardenticatenales bacterium]
MKKLIILLLLVASLLLAACGASGDESRGEITMAKATWDTGWFQAAVFQTMLEELGYEVDDIGTVDNSAFYISAAQGDVDLWVNGWFPLHDEYIADDNVEGKVELVGYQVEAGALQGYLVDKASADELGITSLTDLADPEIAAHFDSDGNGKADLIGCDAGWGCEQVIIDTLAELNLEDTVEQRQGTYSALMADTIGRYSRGEPILFYTWTPNWTVSQLQLGEDVVWIEAPVEGLTPASGITGCAVDPCVMGFAPSDIRVVANTEFLDEHPDVRTLLEEVEIPLNDIAAQNQLMVDGEDSDEDIARHAEEWIEENRAQIDSWLEDARAAQ